MRCMYASYEVMRSNNEEAKERTRQKLQMTRATWPPDVLPLKLRVTHCDLMGCVCISYEVNR